jgi:hypothetical protein
MRRNCRGSSAVRRQFASVLNCWEQQRYQNPDDGNDNEQFNERESDPFQLTGHGLFLGKRFLFAYGAGRLKSPLVPIRGPSGNNIGLL